MNSSNNSSDHQGRETELELHLQEQSKKSAEGVHFFWHKLRSRYVINQLKKHFNNLDQVTLLDVGAGAGVFGVHIKQVFEQINYNFIEPLQSLSIILSEKFGQHAKVLPTQSFNANAVVLMDVLEHQEHDIEFLNNLSVYMAPGALLIITCPAFQSLWSIWDVKLGHFRRYTKASINKTVQAAGYEVVESRYLFQSMFFAGLLRKHQNENKSGAEFPELNPFLNNLIYYLGIIEQELLSKIVPFGSSVAVVAIKVRT